MLWVTAAESGLVEDLQDVSTFLDPPLIEQLLLVRRHVTKVCRQDSGCERLSRSITRLDHCISPKV